MNDISQTMAGAGSGEQTERLGHHARIQRQQEQLRAERANAAAADRAAARTPHREPEFDHWLWKAFEAADDRGRAAVVGYVAIGAFATLGVIEAGVHTWHLLAGLTLSQLVVLAVQAAVFGGGGALWVWARGGKRGAA